LRLFRSVSRDCASLARQTEFCRTLDVPPMRDFGIVRAYACLTLKSPIEVLLPEVPRSEYHVSGKPSMRCVDQHQSRPCRLILAEARRARPRRASGPLEQALPHCQRTVCRPPRICDPRRLTTGRDAAEGLLTQGSCRSSLNSPRCTPAIMVSRSDQPRRNTV
jgi:hypothetical protein